MTDKQIQDLIRRAERELLVRSHREKADQLISYMRTIRLELEQAIELLNENPSLILSINKNKINDFKQLLNAVIEQSRLDKST